MVVALAALGLASCERTPKVADLESSLLSLCAERKGLETTACERVARLRAAVSSEGDASVESDFRAVLEIAQREQTPELVCKATVVGGAYCLQTTDAYALYEQSAIETISAEFAAIAQALERSLSNQGLLLCPDGSKKLLDVSELSDDAFSVRADATSRARSIIAIGRAHRTADRDDEEKAFLDRAAKACEPDEGAGPPLGGPPIPPTQASFSSCMASDSGVADDVLAQARTIGDTAIACVAAALGGRPPSDNPLARQMQDLSTLMAGSAGTSATSDASFSDNGNIQITAQDDEGNTHTLTLAEDSTFTVTDEVGDITASGTMGDDLTEIPDGEGPFAAISVGEDGNIDLQFDDGSQVEVDPTTGDTAKKDKNGDPVEPELEDLNADPPDETTTCAPDDVACECGAKVDLALSALSSCIQGTSQCEDILGAYGCCEDRYASDPLVRIDPAGDFVCEAASEDSAAGMLFCADRCKEFSWEGCMDWCLNGLTLQTPGARWMDNICLYVDGLECPQQGVGAGIGGTDGGLGLPTLPTAFDDPGAFNSFFASSDRALLEGLLIDREE